MLVSGMQTKDTIEIYVINSRLHPSVIETNQETHNHDLLNGNKNNNNNLTSSKSITPDLADDSANKTDKIHSLNTFNEQILNKSSPNLNYSSNHFNNTFTYNLNGSVSALSTGLN